MFEVDGKRKVRETASHLVWPALSQQYGSKLVLGVVIMLSLLIPKIKSLPSTKNPVLFSSWYERAREHEEIERI